MYATCICNKKMYINDTRYITYLFHTSCNMCKLTIHKQSVSTKTKHITHHTCISKLYATYSTPVWVTHINALISPGTVDEWNSPYQVSVDLIQWVILSTWIQGLAVSGAFMMCRKPILHWFLRQALDTHVLQDIVILGPLNPSRMVCIFSTGFTEPYPHTVLVLRLSLGSDFSGGP